MTNAMVSYLAHSQVKKALDTAVSEEEAGAWACAIDASWARELNRVCASLEEDDWTGVDVASLNADAQAVREKLVARLSGWFDKFLETNPAAVAYA